jgi:hypothetical protein
MISGYLLTLSTFGWPLLIGGVVKGVYGHPSADQVSEGAAARAGWSRRRLNLSLNCEHERVPLLYRDHHCSRRPALRRPSVICPQATGSE